MTTIASAREHEQKLDEIIRMFHEERQKIVHRAEQCKKLLEDSESVLKESTNLRDLYLYVSPKTSQIHSECKSVIQERNELRASYDSISSTLNIFKRMPDIKNQLMTILNGVRESYKKWRDEATGAGQQLAPLDEYYGRFYIECRRIREPIAQLESCLSTSKTDELLLHLEEIYTLYFDIREELIVPVFDKSLSTLVAKSDRNYCDLLRHACNSLVRLLRNELQLFEKLFVQSELAAASASPTDKHTTDDAMPTTSKTTPTTSTASSAEQLPIKREKMAALLSLFCQIFYETLRPVVIHVNHLETLSELHMLVTDTMRMELKEECYQSTMSSLAGDIQERMVFRAEVFLKESVLDYKPVAGDLAYPEKLEVVSGGDLKNFQCMWYPTVQRTVLALFYLNRVFDPVTFRELAQEIVVACLRSLDLAQRLIDERHGGTKIEATLFLTKHLAIIKDQLRSFGIDRIRLASATGAEQKREGAAAAAESSDGYQEINTGDLERLLSLFRENQLNAADSGESLWWQLNETIASGTRWTLRATRIQR